MSSRSRAEGRRRAALVGIWGVLIAGGGSERAWAQPTPTPTPTPSPAAAAGPVASSGNRTLGASRASAAALASERLEIDNCPPKPLLLPDRMRKIAAEHYDRGDVLYVQGDYVGAVSEFIASYCLIPHYSVLKDIGQSYERQLEYSRAIAYLKRYVDGVPANATPSACGPAPQEDKRNVAARVEVLSSLPARINVATEPTGAEITLTDDQGIVARSISTAGGAQLLARAGTYRITMTKPGFVTRTEDISVEIGKPYSQFFPLSRESGHLSVQAIPGNARLFLDDRFVGIGRYEADLAGDDYTLLVEASDRISERRKIEVKPRQTERVVVQLSPRPQSGRLQLLVFAPFAGGAVLGGSLNGTSDSVAAIGALGGLAIGGVAGYIAIPDDIPLGTSSAAITGSLAGLGLGLFSALAADGVEDNDYVGPAVAFGTVAGGAAGYYGASRLGLSAGDAALINSGMVWGGVYGGLFAAAFDNPETIDYSLAAGGLGLGLITSGLLVRSFSISRAHAALIDLGGVGGLVLSAGVRSLIDRGEDASGERQANFALGGITIGLAGAALATRNFDDPVAPNMQPSVGRVSTIDGGSVPSYGVTGSF